ncbi:olfactory receptor 1D2 [Alosa alosa]|uniref:olfactory receptor 1D2 n=1 Tax=Alosa alosa TaxID=278164 RepID=UPI0020153307|nr:olfactory receptor 1D2 [Alosa alosa]
MRSSNGSVQAGLTNSSTTLEQLKTLDTIKTYVFLGAFLVTGLLTCLILVTVFGTRALKQKSYYILLCQHCACVTGFNVVGAMLHGLRVRQVTVPRLVCWLIFDVQVALGRCLVITLTLMAINVSLSVCCPLHYRELRRWGCCAMLMAWIVALLNPVLFTILACVQSPWEYVVVPDTLCSTALDGFAARVSSLALLCLLSLLFIVSYVAICVEGCKAGHFSGSNKKGQRTICIHTLQLSLHILPTFIIIARVPLDLTGSIVNFLMLLVAQSISPFVYGLRCYDIWSQLPMFLPQFLLPLWNWCDRSMSKTLAAPTSCL